MKIQLNWSTEILILKKPHILKNAQQEEDINSEWKKTNHTQVKDQTNKKPPHEAHLYKL